jgi:beta-galactosidase
MMNKLYHGAAFYPELWSGEVVREDIQRMAETGINVVRIGELLWSTIEPEEGRIDVTPLAGVIKQLY